MNTTGTEQTYLVRGSSATSSPEQEHRLPRVGIGILDSMPTCPKRETGCKATCARHVDNIDLPRYVVDVPDYFRIFPMFQLSYKPTTR
jgi:hypothetical protein